LAVAIIFALYSCGVAQAQETRTALIAQQQAEKAKQLKPYETSRAEQIFRRFTGRFVEIPSGVFPLIDSVYGGGGFTLGLGYHKVYGDNHLFDLRGLLSVKNYKLVELSNTLQGLPGSKVQVRANIGWRDATQVGFYGLGMDTSVDDRANFRFIQTFGGLAFRLAPLRWTVFHGAVSVENYTLEEGQGSRPSVEERFTPATAPGLDSNPTYMHGFLSAGIDWRPSPGYARRGGLYEVRYHNYADRDDTYTFDRLEAEVVQHLPILRETWVLSVRGQVQTTVDDDDVVPYYLLPALGSGSTLRGYPSWRFRDRHSLLLQGEWRWMPNRLGMDMAIFYDAGKVTSRRSQLDLDGLKSNVGIGVRFHGPTMTPLRIELARGREGLNIVFSGSAAF
jgi:hypothetical protein